MILVIEKFNSLLISDSTGDINNNGEINIGDLAIVSKNYGKNSADINWKEVEYIDLNKDGIIDDYEVHFISNRILNK